MMSTTNTDYWSILGLKPDSNLDQIKTAFRKEARRWHPDLNLNDVNAEERFKLINEAYAILSDPIKRNKWQSNENFSYLSDDIFASGFPSYNEYIELVLGLKSDDENINTYEQERIDDFEQNIDPPNGSMYEDSYKPTKTPDSPPPIRKSTDLETLVDLTPDEAVQGTSLQIELVDGTLVEIETPPFVGDGWRLRLPGVVIGGQDHLIHLRVQTDNGLRIDGLRVLYKLELLPHEALFGCAVDIPTLEGPVTLQVPPYSSSGRLLRLRGRGIEYNDLCGDQIVEIVVVIQSELSESEIALYRRLQELAIEQENL